MDDRLMKKLIREARFYSRKNQQLMDVLEESRLEVAKAKENLNRLKKDLKRTEEILEALAGNGP